MRLPAEATPPKSRTGSFRSQSRSIRGRFNSGSREAMNQPRSISAWIFPQRFARRPIVRGAHRVLRGPAFRRATFIGEPTRAFVHYVGRIFDDRRASRSEDLVDAVALVSRDTDR